MSKRKKRREPKVLVISVNPEYPHYGNGEHIGRTLRLDPAALAEVREMSRTKYRGLLLDLVGADRMALRAASVIVDTLVARGDDLRLTISVGLLAETADATRDLYATLSRAQYEVTPVVHDGPDVWFGHQEMLWIHVPERWD